ncbi:MAG: DUF4037 domain-containing protein [Clostridiales bacterium]|nr:DUF4037 domain-containing protein [Clostridiales bacterium]
MKGLELSEKYYCAYGKKMLEEKFPNIAERAAIGLVGQGSECLGYDDDISKDHDYGPAFCIWLTEEDYKEYGRDLSREYERLPADFEGISGRKISMHGGDRIGVHSISGFYYRLIGCEAAPESNREWLRIPESALCMAVNGKVFADPLGKFSEIRKKLLEFYPEDVRIKKIAARAATMAQAGQYNYARAMKRGEYVAAQLALSEFVKSTISIVYLLNKKYTPFYKWMHHGMKELPVLSEIGDILNLLVETENQAKAWKNAKAEDYLYTLNTEDRRVIIIEAICNLVLQELVSQGLTEGEDNFLENHTTRIMERIKDPSIRSLQIMEG